MRKNALVVCLFFSVMVSANEKGTMYDASSFDIAGVKLGMNWNQAVEALTNQLNVGKNDLRLDKYLREDIVLKKKIAKYFVYENDDFRIQVSFVAAIPVDQTNPLRVNLITYETNRTNENMQKMRDTAFQKYGTPTNGFRDNDHVSMKYSWCSYDQSIKFNSCFNAIGAKLEVTAPQLQLSDPTYLKNIQAYMNKQKSSEMAF